MKASAHAWLALMALERLKKFKRSKSFRRSFLGENFKGYFLGNSFDDHFEKQAESFVKFFDKRKDSFLKGALFPDSVIADNLTGGHTFKLKKPTVKKEEEITALCDQHRRVVAQLQPMPRVIVEQEDGTVTRMDDNDRLEKLRESKTFLAENCDK